MRHNYGAKYRIGDMVRFNKPGVEQTEAYDKIKSIEILITEDSKYIAYGMDLYHGQTVKEEEILEGPNHCRTRRKRGMTVDGCE